MRRPYALHPRFEVVAIASPTNAERVARERKIPHAFRSAGEMLAGVELDVVSVASPPFDHHPSVLAALAAGKHVLLREAVRAEPGAGARDVRGRRAAGTANALAFEFRYVPAVRAVKELIDNGHVGALPRARGRAPGPRVARRQHQPRARLWFSAEKGGGVANAVMPHFFDLANHLAGRAAARDARPAAHREPAANRRAGRVREHGRRRRVRPTSTTATGSSRGSAPTPHGRRVDHRRGPRRDAQRGRQRHVLG